MLFLRNNKNGDYMKSYTILDASIPSFKNMIDYREVKNPFFVKKHYVIKEKSTSY